MTVKVVLLLKKQINKLVDAHRDGKDGLVDYQAVGADPAFASFEEATCELQGYFLTDMPDNVQLAFVINLYNMMIPHAYARFGDPRSDLARLTFFDKTYYNIGGLMYSFTELENGVLRGNKTPPYHLLKPFGNNDPRLQAARVQVKPRIHFALNCGGEFCLFCFVLFVYLVYFYPLSGSSLDDTIYCAATHNVCATNT
jgi:hypothetical protein